MREIKFRVWHKGLKRYFEVIDINFVNGDIGCKSGKLERNFNLQSCVLEQYTGLKDKNDVEIYEGDVIELLKNGTRWRGKVRMDLYEKLSRNTKYIEIIGNINENKEIENE